MRRMLPPIPSDLGRSFEMWASAVEAVISTIPDFSVISTVDGPNVSGVTAGKGALRIDIGSSTTKFWQKRSGSTSTTGWSAFSWI